MLDSPKMSGHLLQKALQDCGMRQPALVGIAEFQIQHVFLSWFYMFIHVATFTLEILSLRITSQVKTFLVPALLLFKMIASPLPRDFISKRIISKKSTTILVLVDQCGRCTYM